MQPTDLVKSIPPAPILDPQERTIIICKNGPMIKAMSQKDIHDSLLVLIGKTFIEAGNTINEGAVRLAMPALLQDINTYFGTLTIAEITNAFKLGLMGEFGEYFGLNNKTYLVWCKSYLGWTKRLEANKKQAAFNLEYNKPPAISEERKEEIMKQGALDAFEYAKTGKQYPDVGNATYNYLDGKKLLPITKQEKLKFMEEALKRVQSNMSNEIERNPNDRNRIKAKINALTNKSDEVISEAKKMALNSYFRELLEIGKELKNILQ